MAISALFILLSTAAPAVGETVVYDTLSNALLAGGLRFQNYEQAGDEVTLSNSVDLAVTKFEVVLEATADAEVVVNFYSNDGPGGEPGTLIWASPPFTVSSSLGQSLYELSVPSVVVPQTFTWTVEPTTTIYPPNDNLFVRNGTPTSLGSSEKLWQIVIFQNDWLHAVRDLTYAFAARISAEPVATCGNAHIDPGEMCDDGNVADQDGCSSVCTLETVHLVDPACSAHTQCAGTYLLQDGASYRVDDRYPDLLATAPVVRNSISTDGISQLLVRVPTDEPVTISVAGPLGFAAGPEYGSLLDIAGATSGSSLLATPSSTATGHFAFAAYRAPTNFPGSFGDVATGIDIEIRADSTVSTRSWSSSLKLVTPPIVLVHGVWSDATAWAGLEAYLQADGFRICATCRLDYGSAAPAGSFDPGATTAIDRHAVTTLINASWSALEDSRSKGIAASQVDVIGHSMGGLVARARVARPAGPLDLPYARAENYGSGEFHKLITVGTPHFGSPLADWFIEHACDYMTWGAGLQTLEEIFASRGRPLGPAIDGLRPGSSSLRALGTTTVPTHSIVGIAPSASQTENILDFLMWTNRNNLLTDTVSSVLGGTSNHDTIVPTSSQQGSLAAASFLPGLVHASLNPANEGETESAGVWFRVEELLLADVSGGLFGSVPPPPGPAVAPPSCHPVSSAQSLSAATGVATLSSPQGPLIVPGQDVTLQLSLAGGNPIDGALFFFGNEIHQATGPPPLSLTVTMPDRSAGSLQVFSDTYGPGPENYTASLQLTIAPTAPLESLSATPDRLRLFEPDELFQMRVEGRYEDGSSLELTSESAGTTYALASGNSGVVTLISDGLLQGAGAGSDVLEIRNGGHLVSIPVLVPEPSALAQALVSLLALGGFRFVLRTR